MEIRVLWRQGMSIREIARNTGVSRNTVRRYLRTASDPAYGPRPPQGSKLDPFKDYLVVRCKAAHPDRLPGTVLLKEIRSMGYDGGITILRDYLRAIRPTPAPDPVVRFETRPGEQLQVDFCSVRKGTVRLSAFVAVLGYSRAAFVRFVSDERLETLLTCHEEAFFYFGGVPRSILYDNMKTVVIERDGYGPGRHRFHPRFRDFAGHHGFAPRLCRPYRAKTKGKVERFISYLRGSFIVPLATRLRQAGLTLDVATANAEVLAWLRETANERMHGTTGHKPSALLVEDRRCLLPLPPPWVDQARPAALPVPHPIQRDLSVYDELLRATAEACP
jgi:transposase